MFPLLVKILLF